MRGQTVQEISRATSIPRPSIYRILEKLIPTQLVIESVSPRGKRYEIGNFEALNVLVNQKENDLKEFNKNVITAQKFLNNMSIPEMAKTKILSYKGEDGLKQITWNSTKAKDTLMIIEKSSMSEFLDYGFCERARTEFLLNKIQVKEITNSPKIQPWTDITQFVEKNWKCRNISPTLFKINFEILIYNDVYSMYTYENDDIVGVEIYNQKLADMQKQLFNFLWKNGTTMKKQNNHGKASLD